MSLDLTLGEGPEESLLEPMDGVAVRHLLRELRPKRRLLSLAMSIYIGLLTVGIVVGLSWGFWRRVGPVVADLVSSVRFFWAPAVILIVVIGILRFCIPQGFVSFTEADCFTLLLAPIHRREFVWPRLRAAVLLTGSLGALAGVVVLLATAGKSATWEGVLSSMVAAAALGVGLVGAGWQIERLPRASIWMSRLTLPACGLALLVGLLERSGPKGHAFALWSGPWGWVLVPASAYSLPFRALSLGLLLVLAAAAVLTVVKTSGRCSIEIFRVRARTRSRALAGLYGMDARQLLVTARDTGAPRWVPRLRFPSRPRGRPAVAMHGMVSLLRSPLRLAWGLLLAGASVMLLAGQPPALGALLGGAFLLYLSASALLEPLRVEVDSRATARTLLPWRFGTILSLHCLVPAALLFLGGVLGLAASLVLGRVGAWGAAQWVLLLLPLSFLAACGGALAARRGGRVSSELLLTTAGDATGMSGGLIVLYFLFWPVLVVGLIAGAAYLVSAPSQSHIEGYVLALAAAGVLMLLLFNELPRKRA